MKELKCPHCGNVFTVDESDYAALLVSKVEIYDINGKIVTRTDSLVDIESLSLQPGVYVVKTIFSNDTFETHKIIK